MKDDRKIELASPVRRMPTLRSRIGGAIRFGLRGLVGLAGLALVLELLSIPLWIIAGTVANARRAEGEQMEEGAFDALNLSTELQLAYAAVLAIAVVILILDGVVSRLRGDAEEPATHE